MLAENLAVPIKPGIAILGAPVALGGRVVAVLVLGLESDGTLVLIVTLLVGILTFTSPRTNALQGSGARDAVARLRDGDIRADCPWRTDLSRTMTAPRSGRRT